MDQSKARPVIIARGSVRAVADHTGPDFVERVTADGTLNSRRQSSIFLPNESVFAAGFEPQSNSKMKLARAQLRNAQRDELFRYYDA
jgi:hypothetical protein